MADLYDLLGVSKSTGLGPVMTAMNSQRTSDMDAEKGLAAIYESQQRSQAANLDNLMKQRTMESEIAATNAMNENKVMTSQADRMNQFGQFASQLGAQLSRMPLEQRQQAFSQIGNMLPGMAENDIYQNLLNMDPALLPDALQTLGGEIASGTSEFIRDTQMQGQKDDAAMARTQADNDAAMARTQAGIGANFGLERMRIDAGKYQKRQGGVATLMDIAGKAGYEKAATAAMIMANDQDASESDRVFFRNMAEEFAQANERARSAGATGAAVIDPNSPTGIGRVDPYGQQNNPIFAGGQQQPAPQSGGIEAAVRASGVEYDPQNYDYRIAPDGSVQRKRK